MKIVVGSRALAAEALADPRFALIGAEPVVAANAEQAAALVARWQAPLLVVDGDGGGGADGFSFAQRVERDEALRATAVILRLGTPASPADLQRAAAAGVDDLIGGDDVVDDLYGRAARLLGWPQPCLVGSAHLAVAGVAGARPVHPLSLAISGVDLLAAAPVEVDLGARLWLRRDGDADELEVDGTVAACEPAAAGAGFRIRVHLGPLATRARARLADLALWSARRTDGGAGVHIALRGAFDEASDFLVLHELLAARVLFDVSAVRTINSWGAKRWILFLRSLPADATYAFSAASTVFVRHCSMVADMLGRGVVRSFAAPYDCAACAGESERLLPASAMGPALRVQPPEFVCRRCGGADRFADVAERYFAFLR